MWPSEISPRLPASQAVNELVEWTTGGGLKITTDHMDTGLVAAIVRAMSNPDFFLQEVVWRVKNHSLEMAQAVALNEEQVAAMAGHGAMLATPPVLGWHIQPTHDKPLGNYYWLAVEEDGTVTRVRVRR